MTISEWLAQTTNTLANERIPSAQLDSELILTHTINRPRTWLHAHGEDKLDDRQVEIANARVRLRQDHTPIAYIIGHKEFYGRRFMVSPAVLVPRPETEQIIELLKELSPTDQSLPGIVTKRLVDVGTGSGCLGITAKLEFPDLDVTLTDYSRHALKVALKNSKILHANVSMLESDLLTSYPYQPEIILSNLPYVDKSWDNSPDIEHEPAIALYADDDGLALIKQLIEHSEHRLAPSGLLILEADKRQIESIATFAQKLSFKMLGRREFAIALQKV